MKQLQCLGVVALFLAATVAVTQQPQVTDTQFKSEPASSELSATVDRFLHLRGPLWLGYEVPAVPGTHFCSCANSLDSRVDDGCGGEYQLEQGGNRSSHDAKRFLPSSIYVLLRLDGGKVIRVRAVSAGCRLNAGGVPFQWLTDVQQDQSVALLRRLAIDSPEIAEQTLIALSAHATSKATDTLADFAVSSNPELREKAAFWLGVQRGHDGFVILQRLIRAEQDSEHRKKLTFDLFVSSDPAAVDELLRIAKSDSDADVRGQAIFWVAQKAGNKAAAAVQDAIQNDPEIQVKKKAVFALSQLPADEGIPRLIELARTYPNPAVRKQAVFWLGQTKDPRALQFLEEVLKH